MRPRSLLFSHYAKRVVRQAAVGVLAVLASVATITATAQTVTLTTDGTQNYWAGVNTTNNFTNNIAVVETGGGGATNIVLSLLGANGTTVSGTLTPNILTSNGTSGLALAVTNAAKNVFPLTISASGDAAASTGFNLFVVPQWAQTNGGSTGNWSDATKWSGGAVPLTTDSVYIDHSVAGPWTNIVDSSRSIQDLIFLTAGANDNKDINLSVNTTIAAGQTLSVLGTNGFAIGNYKSDGFNVYFNFVGDTLLVSNSLANFSISESHNANDSKWMTVDMRSLTNLNLHVSKMDISDVTAIKNGPLLTSLVNFYLAQTSSITATWTDDYNKPSFDTSITYMRETEKFNNNNAQSGNAQFRLGNSSKFNADSFGVGLGNVNSSGSAAFSMTFGYRVTFASLNDAAPTSSAIFRNADGVSRMSLLAVGVDTGLGKLLVNNSGVMDLHGGMVDMLVDQIWLGQTRTNNTGDANGKNIAGGLWFDWGTVDCNTLLAGNMKYTNNCGTTIGMVRVGTNGTLVVNSNLVLGKTPSDVTGFEIQAGKVSGQLQIDNGGTIRTKQITVGQFSANNNITVNSGGTLEVSNTVGTLTTKLSSLTVNSGGALTLHKNAANTLVYVTNLVSSGGVINIGSVTGAGSFAPIISYEPGFGESASFVAGSVPSGYNASIFNNTTTHTIDLTLTTGTPKTLVWKGYTDNNWDNTTKNWLDSATGLHTNFSTGDSVVFDDTASFNTVNVAEDVVPRQSVGVDGMIMTNNLNAYTFSGAGGIRGAASFSKYGTNSVEIDNYSEIAVTVNQGLLTGSGTIGSAIIASGAAGSLLGGGTVLGDIVNSGSLTNSGTINGKLTAQTGSTVNYNFGTLGGALTMQAGTLVYNSGTFNSIGSATVVSNSTLINAGTIYGGSVTVDKGGSLSDLVPGSSGVSPGSINVTNLIINGTFNPGGSGIATTKVTNYRLDGNQSGPPAGRVQLNAGSVTTFYFNSTNAQPYTKLLSQNQVFGPSQNFKAINGCTLVISNVGPTAFTAGQSFKLFGLYYNDGNILDAGLNTTNSYPIIVPTTPGAGLLWDMSQLYPGGTISVVSAASVQFALTNTAYVINSGSNVVNHLSWPSDKIGGWVQQLNTTLTNGLSATNWITPSGGYLTNLTGVSDIYITNTLVADPTAPGSAVFYRFVYP